MIAAEPKKDFFISYTQADQAWAEWIAWTLEEEGWSTTIQAWDFRPASNFVRHMDSAIKNANRVVAVLSSNYVQSGFARSEWFAAFAQDPTGESGTLLPVRVGKFDRTGLLAQVVYIDLMGRDKFAAAEALLAGARRGRAKPATPPPFPGEAKQNPPYPGDWQSKLQSRSRSQVTSLEKCTDGDEEDDSGVRALPPKPDLVIGREKDSREIVDLLRANQGPVVLTGWPGVGKTIVARLLLDSKELKTEFPDGRFWVELRSDDSPVDVLAKLVAVLRIQTDKNAITDIHGFVSSLRSYLNKRRLLLVIDDVWTIDQGEAFRSVLGEGVGALLTTRFPSVARRIVLRPAFGVYPINQLNSQDGFRLIATLAPAVAELVPDELKELTEQLEGLPLALQVAGRLLAEEHRLGLSVLPLLAELSDAHRLLEERAPEDRFDSELGTTPTIRLLFARSTDHLDEQNRERFALLGEWTNPVMFDTEMLAELWETRDPLSTLRKFADLGLVEPIGDGWFRMHALLIAHASHLLD